MRRLPAGDARPGGTVDPRFRAFEALVRKEARSAWRLADYAQALGISTRHLSRICHAASGVPAAAYIETARLTEARRLLVYSRDSVAEIGYQLGFDDPSYFSRAFRRHTGQTPSDYRASFEQD
jgi:AraC family transcriptional activator of pobA